MSGLYKGIYSVHVQCTECKRYTYRVWKDDIGFGTCNTKNGCKGELKRAPMQRDVLADVRARNDLQMLGMRGQENI